jgi:hypothetical protein
MKKPVSSSLKHQKGEIPIGPILIIALIVVPLILLLVSFGQSSGDQFTEQADQVIGSEMTIKEIKKK